jgi:hypothetical protein
VVKLNAEKSPKIWFAGNLYELKNGLQELVIALVGKENMKNLAYPMLVFLDEKYQVIFRQAGFSKAKDMSPILAFFGKDIYLKQDWKTFMEMRK